MSRRIFLLLIIYCTLTSCDFLLTTPFSPHLQRQTLTPDIIVKHGSLRIPSGESLEVGGTIVGTPRDVTLTIENLGTVDLALTGNPVVAISGIDASSFCVLSQPSTRISGGKSSTLTIDFIPTSSGAKSAKASIDSNDPDTTTYFLTITGAGSSAVSGLPYSEISDPENWSELRQYLNEQAALGVSGTPAAVLGSITGPLGGYKWVGGVLAPNGKIYCLPRAATNVLIIDPATDTGDTTTIAALAGSDKWSAGVLAPNQKVYGIPFNSTSVLIIDPQNNTADTTTISGLSAMAKKWAGGTLASNGKIYAVPADMNAVLIIDPKSIGAFSDNIILSAYFNNL
jgi:hypothetical protein